MSEIPMLVTVVCKRTFWNNMPLWSFKMMFLSYLYCVSKHFQCNRVAFCRYTFALQPLDLAHAVWNICILSWDIPHPFPTGQMTDLIFTERELVQSLKDYIKAEESKLAAVKR